jgi:long-chain acyl-CoA synthetase
MVHTLQAQAARLTDRPALWTKRDGVYLPTSWRQYERQVKHFALGLASLGFGPNDALTIIGFNREEWLVADLAAMAMGGVPVGLYVTSSPEQIQYITAHCAAPVMLVENERFLETVQSVRAHLPRLKHLIVMDEPKVPAEGVLSYREVLERGAKADERLYHERVAALDPAGLATLIYTSGTTGNPKGVMLSHRNLTWTAAQLTKSAGVLENEVLLSYLPLSHIAEQLCSIHGPVVNGIQVYFAESLEALPKNLREVRPTAFFGVPRVWEKFKAKAEDGMRALPENRKRVLQWARKVASRRHGLALERQRVPARLELQYQLARRLVFSAFKEKIGFDRTHIFATSAAPIGRDVLDFFASMDMVLHEVYGQSEVTGPTSVNGEGATRLGTLGRPMPGVTVRIAEDGEILVKGENVCLGYFREEAATAELLEDGWLHSGDVGRLDSDGYLHITGRKKEIIVTSGGKKTPPATLEGLLKAIDPVGNALVVGDGRNYLVALLPLDPDKAASLAKERGLPTDLAQLATDERFLTYLQNRVEREVNARVSKFETIKRFHVLPHDFTTETGELTATLKVRRKVCEQKYKALIEALYQEPAK